MCGRFAAEHPGARRYRSIAGLVPALCNKCGLCHVDSQRMRLNTDLFNKRPLGINSTDVLLAVLLSCQLSHKQQCPSTDVFMPFAFLHV